MLFLTEEQVLCQGLEFVGFTPERQDSVNWIKNEERFKSHFGSLPIVYAQLWMALQETTFKAAKVHGATPSEQQRSTVRDSTVRLRTQQRRSTVKGSTVHLRMERRHSTVKGSRVRLRI